MGRKGLLVLGLGNLLMGDDGIGVHVINSLREEDFPEYVDVVDGGTGGLNILDMIIGYSRVIVVDALKMMDDPSPDLLILTAADVNKGEGNFMTSMHDIDFVSMLELVKALNMELPDITIIGIPVEDVSAGMGLTEGCRKCIPHVVKTIKDMIE